jgi:hypothetical protein
VTPTEAEAETTELDKSYPANFLDCRDLRHPWRAVGYYHAGGYIIRVLICPRCDTTRRDRWSADGSRYPPTYTYPDGYRIGGGGVAMYEVRQEVLSRVTVYETEDQMNAELFKPRRRTRKGA